MKPRDEYLRACSVRQYDCALCLCLSNHDLLANVGEAFRVVDVPVENVEVVLVKDGQEIEDGLNGEEFPACV